jgi:hypothetical protein
MSDTPGYPTSHQPHSEVPTGSVDITPDHQQRISGFVIGSSGHGRVIWHNAGSSDKT